MSWFNECTLTYEEFEKIRLYLILFKTLIEVEHNFKADVVGDILDKLNEWLRKE